MKGAVLCKEIPNEVLEVGDFLVVTEETDCGYMAVDNDRFTNPLYLLKDEVQLLGDL